MKLHSTKQKDHLVSLQEAVLKGLPDDNGLYMPTDIPPLPAAFIKNLSTYSFQEIGYQVAKTLFKDAIPDVALQDIIQNSLTFPAPLHSLSESKHVLELYHGPSLAFKDFGARFMAQLMGYFNREEEQELIILVATSGDTGGAVAAGFHRTPGIKVVILYPTGKVSFLQEKQLTTLGENITALEVAGTFDDCQALVKQAFLDSELRQKIRLSSANSINIARLVPQSFYYFEAFKQLERTDEVVFSVPSGNFGNLTAGLLAKKMGLPIHHMLAATNINDVVPAYLATGTYTPRPSVQTISNAMDVGNPSNFYRMAALFNTELDSKDELNNATWQQMRTGISGYKYTDQATRTAIKAIKEKYDYIIDPHGAVGYLALEDYHKKHPNANGIILETAHPAKFKDEVEAILQEEIVIPSRLASLSGKEKVAVYTPNDYDHFKNWLLNQY